jgi:hypothetical protein
VHGDTAFLKSTGLNGSTELLQAITYTGDVSLHMISKPYEPYICYCLSGALTSAPTYFVFCTNNCQKTGLIAFGLKNFYICVFINTEHVPVI